jgi:hypothetical protein
LQLSAIVEWRRRRLGIKSAAEGFKQILLQSLPHLLQLLLDKLCWQLSAASAREANRL